MSRTTYRTCPTCGRNRAVDRSRATSKDPCRSCAVAARRKKNEAEWSDAQLRYTGKWKRDPRGIYIPTITGGDG